MSEMRDMSRPVGSAEPTPTSSPGEGGAQGGLRHEPAPTRPGAHGSEPQPTVPRHGIGTSITRNWVQRAEGDRRARARLRLLEAEGIIVLNDRRIPGSRDSIKLIAVSCAGVFVIDTKHYKGLVHTMRPGSIGNLGPHELHVGRRNCTSSVEQVARQMEAVRASLNSTPYWSQVPVHGMLCLTRAEWGFASAIQVGGVWVGWPNLMAGRVQSPGVMDSPAVREVSTMLTDLLPGS
jgi:hypothetical protein